MARDVPRAFRQPAVDGTRPCAGRGEYLLPVTAWVIWLTSVSSALQLIAIVAAAVELKSYSRRRSEVFRDIDAMEPMERVMENLATGRFGGPNSREPQRLAVALL